MGLHSPLATLVYRIHNRKSIRNIPEEICWDNMSRYYVYILKFIMQGIAHYVSSFRFNLNIGENRALFVCCLVSDSTTYV